MILFAVYLLYSGLSNYNRSYDSGVYLESARMMGRGFALYRQIFNSQPPLWLPLIYTSFRLFGESFLAGQLVTATAGLITIVSVMLMTSWPGEGGSILAGILITLSPLELQWSRSINADVPSVAFTAISMACASSYARNGRRGWLVAASVAAIGSILLKLSGVYAVPALLLFVIARWKTPLTLRPSRRLWLAVGDVFIMAGIFAGLTLVSLVLLRSDQVWNQAVTFHWAARTAFATIPLGEKWHKLVFLLAGERLLLSATPLAIFCLLAGLDGIAVFAWPCCTFLGLLQHYPLYDHHLVALIPALAAAIGVGASYSDMIYWPYFQWLWARMGRARIIARTACTAAALAILVVVTREGWTEALDAHASMRNSTMPTMDSRIVELIIQHTRPDDMIITDDQGLAFLAARDVPPDLTDTSYTRIASGYLQSREVINQAEQYNVRLVLLWTGRLSSMPEVLQWAEKRFPLRIELGGGRMLYMVE